MTVSSAAPIAPALTPSAAASSPSTASAVARKALAWLRVAEPWGQALVLLSLRLLSGALFAQTGWGKLANQERITGFFESLGLPAPGLMAALAGGTELLGGALLALGLGTRFAAAALSGVMLTAYATAHAADAFASLTAFTEQAPYPFLVTSLVSLVFGAGRLSGDRALQALLSRRAN